MQTQAYQKQSEIYKQEIAQNSALIANLQSRVDELKDRAMEEEKRAVESTLQVQIQ